MVIADIMTKHVQVISPNETLQRAAPLMARNQIGMMPGMGKGRLVGTLTDRDLTPRAVADGLYPDASTVREAMSPEVNYVFEDESIDAAVRAMSELKIRRLPVLNRNEELVGIISLGDIALSEQYGAGDALQSISR